MMKNIQFLTMSSAAVLLAGCASLPAGAPISSLPPVTVAATGETEPVGTTNADAADDPAIWRNPANPAQSLIVATDKKAGLYVYGLDGRVKSFYNAGRVNNVDLIEQDGVVHVVASDRNDPTQAKLAVFRLDGASGKLIPLGTVAGGTGEAYGVCLMPGAGGTITAFSVLKDGNVHEVSIALGASPSGRIIRSLKLATQTEGCAIDRKTGSLYVGEEDVGIWRFDASGSAVNPIKVAAADNRELVADVEGLAVATLPDGSRILVASSQGDNTYAVYRIGDGGTLTYAGRFEVKGGPIGGTSETDGLDLVIGDFGPAVPGGLFVAQDGHNGNKAQNFKLVSWAAIAAALGL